MRYPEIVEVSLQGLPGRMLAVFFLLGTISAAAQTAPQPGKGQDLLKQGMDLLKKGSADSAEALFRQAALQDQENAIPWYYLGSAQMSRQDSRSASESFEKALRLDDAKPALGHKLRREAVDGLGLSLAYQKEYAKAKEVYEAGIAKDPEAPGLRYNLACVCALSGDRAGATASLRDALIADARLDAPTLPDPSADGDFKGLLGDPVYQATLLVTLGPQPNDRPGDALVREGAKLLAYGDLPGAAAKARSALEAEPKSARAWFLLGGALEQSKDAPGAAEAFRKAIELNAPPNPVLSKPVIAHAALFSGSSYLEAKEYGEALKSYQTATEADAFKPVGYYGEARAYADLGQRDAALAALKKAFALRENLTALDPPLPDPSKDTAFAAWAQDKEWQAALSSLVR